MNNKLWSNNNGLVTLSPPLLELKSRIDACFLKIAEKHQADAMYFPPMLPVADVDQLDYFVNFPHLPLAVSLTNAKKLDELRKETTGSRWTSIKPAALQEANLILPPAACYAVYTHHREADVGDLRTVTTLANCCRNEKEYVGLQRLKSFTMREIVLIGEMESVTQKLNALRDEVKNLAQSLDIQISLEHATDPFFDPTSARAAAQKLFPVKQELVYRDGTAIASANFHRNFFGERFNIESNGQVAYTACIGMGLERWLHALMAVYRNDVDAANEVTNLFLERYE